MEAISQTCCHLRRRWDSTASIINAFQPFYFSLFQRSYLYPSHYCTPSLWCIIMLIFHKPSLLSIIMLILQKGVLYYDPTVECHTQEYYTFAAIAVCVLVIFIVCPTILLILYPTVCPTILLILYPTRLFRRCVLCCEFRRWHALYVLVESFQRQYKDGTNGTCDFRMVSASFFVLRTLMLVLFVNHQCLTSKAGLSVLGIERW